MTIEIRSDIGFTAQLPEGSLILEESQAGPDSEQISLPGDVLFSIERITDLVHDYAEATEWTEKSAAYYQQEFDGAVLTQGRLQSPGKEVYAVAVSFADAEQTPRIATVIGIRFLSGEFFGLTLISVHADPQPQADLQLIQSLVDGIELS
ncbi:hypothetical protein [Psychromicrobium xiongbiense]|uniref:hypothetical protein n=1 Tax=Psychromicrobium xiongbiense TaxID=3051184 RepID=UPI002557885E|nr:hypothetical protein [Psychromicrobium sp. YIM S02556]